MGIISIVLGMILVNNYIFSQFLGICPFLGVSKKLDSAIGMGGAVIFVMVVATAVTWPIQQILDKFEIGYLQTVVFILVIAALVQLIEMMLKKYIPSLYSALGVYLPLITTNCAVLGVCIANIDAGYSFGASLANAFGAAVGFTIALCMFAGVRMTKLSKDEGVPESFKGVPLVLISSAIMAMSFTGFSGMFS